jgi:hypothetical protein
MDIKELHVAWSVDRQLYVTQLQSQTANIATLHHKYYELFLAAKIELREAEKTYAKLKLLKYNHYDQGASKETKAKYDWAKKGPAKGAAITRKELDIYLDADDELQELKEKVESIKDKMDFLEEIIGMIKNRSFHLRLIFDVEKFKNGE